MTEQEQAYKEIQALFEKAFRLAKKHDLKIITIVVHPDGKRMSSYLKCSIVQAASMIRNAFKDEIHNLALRIAVFL